MTPKGTEREKWTCTVCWKVFTGPTSEHECRAKPQPDAPSPEPSEAQSLAKEVLMAALAAKHPNAVFLERRDVIAAASVPIASALASARQEAQPAACREERARLVRIANKFGAGVALAACGFERCPEHHPGTDQRCLLGRGHVRDDGYSIHQSENVLWPTEARK